MRPGGVPPFPEPRRYLDGFSVLLSAVAGLAADAVAPQMLMISSPTSPMMSDVESNLSKRETLRSMKGRRLCQCKTTEPFFQGTGVSRRIEDRAMFTDTVLPPSLHPFGGCPADRTNGLKWKPYLSGGSKFLKDPECHLQIKPVRLAADFAKQSIKRCSYRGTGRADLHDNRAVQ